MFRAEVLVPPVSFGPGLLRGPKPPVPRLLEASYPDHLTHVLRHSREAPGRVTRLARLYCTIKRVLAKDAPWARDNADALPQYTTRNVVAFLQNPDGAIRTLCLMPDDLCKDRPEG